MRFRSVLAVLGVTVGLAALGDAAAATILEEASLDRLVDESGTAFLVDVVKIRFGKDERGLHSTWVTVRVEDPIFGDSQTAAGSLYGFKTYGAPVRMADGSRVFIDGTPSFREGETVLLMLLPVSRWGFSGTAGLSQGVFRVTGPTGARSARSFDGKTAVPYPTLRQAIVDRATATGKGLP